MIQYINNVKILTCDIIFVYLTLFITQEMCITCNILFLLQLENKFYFLLSRNTVPVFY